MTETLRESQVTEISDKLRVYSQLIEEVKIGQVDVSELDSMTDTIERWLLEGQLNTFDKLMSYYVLGHAYCTKKCQLYAPSEAMYNNHIAMKEIYYYRMTLFVVNGIMQKKLLSLFCTALRCAYQAYVHLGNVYDHIGRHQDALHSYSLARTLMPNDYMWKFNIGFSLGNMYGYYEIRTQPFVIEKAKEFLKPFLDKPETSHSALEVYKKIERLNTPFKVIDENYVYNETEKDMYSMWVNDHCLRLNAYNDVNSHSKLAQEDNLYCESIFTPKGQEKSSFRLISMLNEIKQGYVSARYMLYEYFQKSGSCHFSDDNVILLDNYQYSNYSYNVELAKAAFRSLYSLLDKIAFALNDYLSLGIKGKNISFNSFWYSDKKKRTLRPEILSYTEVISLAGLLFIRNDIYGGSDSFLQAEETKSLQMVRNAIEHRSIQIIDQGVMEDKSTVLYISREDFEEVSMNLIRTVRQAIFCFVNAISHISYDKIQEAKEHGLVMSQYYDDVPDCEKV